MSTPTTAAALLETVYELGRVATTPVQQAELDYVTTSRAAATTIAENYVGAALG